MKQIEKLKQTTIREIPSDLIIKKLDELGETKTGKGTKKLPKGNFPIIGSNGILGYTDEFLEDDDLIFTGRVGTIGKINFQEKQKIWLSDNVLYFKTKNIELLQYVYYFLKNFDFSYLNVGSSQPLVKQSDFKELKIKLPQNTQDISFISNSLSNLDRKIEVNQKMNKVLEQIAQTIFKSWFVDYEFPDENGRPYRSSGGKMQESKLGQIPKIWTISKLKKYVITSKGCSYRSIDLQESNIFLVTLKSINRGGGFNQKGYKKFIGKYNEDHILSNGDIIVAQTDLTQKAEVIGRPAIVNSLNKHFKLIASLDLQIIRPKENFSKYYIYGLLKTPCFHNHALSHINGTTVLHLNRNTIPEFMVAIPSKHILKKFDAMMFNIFKKIHFIESEINIISNLRDIILPKLMSGEIRV